MAGAKTASLGRVLTALGVVWMGWAVFTRLFELGGELEDLGLPFLPGLIVFFVGRAMTKAGERKPLPEPGQSPQEAVEPVARRIPPSPAPEPVIRHEPEPDIPAEPLPDLSDLEDEILEPPPPMTSDEMVAEARRRFGPRPIEDDG